MKAGEVLRWRAPCNSSGLRGGGPEEPVLDGTGVAETVSIGTDMAVRRKAAGIIRILI